MKYLPTGLFRHELLGSYTLLLLLGLGTIAFKPQLNFSGLVGVSSIEADGVGSTFGLFFMVLISKACPRRCL